MNHLIVALFDDSDHAGKAVSELKDKGHADEISVIAKDEDGKISSENVEGDTAEDAAKGAAVGGVLGGLAGVIAGLSTIAVPGIGTLLVAGPITAAMGLTGGAIGALGGGIVGALTDIGIPEDKAKVYAEGIEKGEVLISIESEHEKEDDVENVLASHNASEIYRIHEDT